MSRRQPETTSEWLEYFDKLRRRAEINYQESGEPRYENAQYKYEVICDALIAKLKDEDERDYTINQRIKNMESAIERLYKNEYTKEEVVDLLKSAIWW